MKDDVILVSHSTQTGNGSHGFSEPKYCKQVADRVFSILARHEVNAFQIDPAGTFYDHFNLAKSLLAKWSMVIHTNANTSDADTWQVRHSGPVVYCYDAVDFERTSTKYAYRVAAGLAEIWQKPCPVLTHRFKELTVPGCSSVYPELGYHDNPADQEFLLNNWEKFAIMLASVQLEMIGVAYDGADLKPAEPVLIYQVQAGAFKNLAYAENMAAALAAAGFPGAYIRKVEK